MGVLFLASISTGTAVLIGSLAGAASLLSTVATLVKVRPERRTLIAQASEHAVSTMSEAFERLESELKRALDEVRRLGEREAELLRRIDTLVEEKRRELERLRERERELLAEVAALQTVIAGHLANAD